MLSGCRGCGTRRSLASVGRTRRGVRRERGRRCGGRTLLGRRKIRSNGSWSALFLLPGSGILRGLIPPLWRLCSLGVLLLFAFVVRVVVGGCVD